MGQYQITVFSIGTYSMRDSPGMACTDLPNEPSVLEDNSCDLLPAVSVFEESITTILSQRSLRYLDKSRLSSRTRIWDPNSIKMKMGQQEEPASLTKRQQLRVEQVTEIIDYEYNHFGSRAAVSDPEGNVVVYQRNKDNSLVYESQFKASNSSIWKISWAHPKFGDLIAIGSFSKGVSVFQQRGNEWLEVAYHQLHEASVNEVCWAPHYFGLKLFACSSDGCFSVLQVKDGGWASRLFKGHEMSVNSIAVERRSVLETLTGFEQTYPNISTASKDKTVCLWVYEQGDYKQKLSHPAHKEPVRKILWRQPSYRPSTIQLFSCSEDGILKLLTVKNNAFEEQILLSQPNPIVKISQSPTGNLVVASFSKNDINTSAIVKEENGKWEVIEEVLEDS